jgi:hypothetical protein
MQDAVEDNQNELTQPAGDYLMEVDNEPIASSSALQLENLLFASFIFTGDASANHALDLLRPQEKKNKLAKKQLLPVTGHSNTFSGIVMGSSTRTKRQCNVCISAGCDGSNCPGSGGRSKCSFV